MIESYSLEQVRTLFQIAVSELDVFPSIAQIEEIATANGVNQKSDAAKPSKIEEQECFFCDGFGLVEVCNPEVGSNIFTSCPECENGKKQSYWNKYNWELSVKKHGKENARQTCPPYSQMKQYGFTPVRFKAARFIEQKNVERHAKSLEDMKL